jgi:hypothetical protein
MPTITVPESFLQVARARKCVKIQLSQSMTAMWIKAGALELPYLIG